ncbi:hypothetical protein [Gallaecimonas pentaromativorans]|uniref:hypothetical protein n=1 Tax=Gallaecimonas pentaromativorans TaxID=584787 RepID=UPI003A92D829
MKKFSLDTKWYSGDFPKQSGIYLIAVRYKTGFGGFEFGFWNGDSWSTSPSMHIVAWAETDTLINSLELSWPESDDTTMFKRQTSTTDGDDDFIEV